MTRCLARNCLISLGAALGSASKIVFSSTRHRSGNEYAGLNPGQENEATAVLGMYL